jgi:hypothetical protein
VVDCNSWSYSCAAGGACRTDTLATHNPSSSGSPSWNRHGPGMRRVRCDTWMYHAWMYHARMHYTATRDARVYHATTNYAGMTM